MAFSEDTTWTFNVSTGYTFTAAESEFTGGYWHAKAAFTGTTTCQTPTLDVSAWEFIDRLAITATEAVDYYHRFLVSFDDAATWNSYGPGGWYPVAASAIGTLGLSKAQIIAALREFPTPGELSLLIAAIKSDAAADGSIGQVTIYYKATDAPEQQTPTGEPVATETLEDDLLDGTTPLQPSFPIRREVIFYSREDVSEANYSASSSAGTAMRDFYPGLEWRGLTTARKNLVLAFLQAHVQDAFNWTPVGFSEKPFVAVSSSIDAMEISAGIWTVRVDLLEALA